MLPLSENSLVDRGRVLWALSVFQPRREVGATIAAAGAPFVTRGYAREE